MSCTGCFGGCAEITPDKCIKYTGADISDLGISNGDTLLSVEQKIIQYLLGALDGSGINITIDAGYLCGLVTGYLGASTGLDDIIIAIVRSICSLSTDVQANASAISTLNADYDVDCLAGVTNSSDTHLVVQAVIDTLCALSTSFSNLVAALPTTYVAIEDLNSLIQSYLDSISAGSLISEKMVPYVAMPYFGSLSYFNASGAGTGNWVNVYLCNGANGTPDLRGRVIVSVTNVTGGGAYNNAVDPGISGNPNYVLNDVAGQNNITLSTNQIPSHSHATEVTLTDNGHSHYEFVNAGSASLGSDVTASTYPYRRGDVDNNLSYRIVGTNIAPTVGKSSTETTGITAEVTNPSVGSGDSHSNVQPVYASNFIIYIPA